MDISSQRQDELDLQSLAYITAQIQEGKTIAAHAIRMAQAGASVIMIDLADTAVENFKAAIAKESALREKLRFVQKDFSTLAETDIPMDFNMLYSQRAIHYVPYAVAERIIAACFNRMAENGMVYISAAGYDTEYGMTYPDRAKPVERRFDHVARDMQIKHGIEQKIVTYKEADMAALLVGAGFRDLQITRSAFGNIKAIARKP